MAGEFYKQLYSAEDCNIDSAEDLLKELPQLGNEQKKVLDSVITFDELTEALHQLSKGRSPGTQQFWNLIGPDLHEVISECIKVNLLPTSCRRAVLSLLPKKEDLGLLTNWRPV